MDPRRPVGRRLRERIVRVVEPGLAREDVARLQARAGDGIEGVIVGQALYRGALSLPEAIRLAQGSL